MTNKEHIDYCKNCDVEPPAMKFKCPSCEHNPDKQPVIIDGVNVSVCPACNLNCGIPQCSELFKYFLSGIYCRDNINCLFKQLARKTQECEELISGKDFYLQKIAVLEQECEELENKIKKLRKNLALEIEINDRYRKALQEIEILINEFYCSNCKTDTICQYCQLGQIKRTINEGIANVD